MIEFYLAATYATGVMALLKWSKKPEANQDGVIARNMALTVMLVFSPIWVPLGMLVAIIEGPKR